jgi:hypothetical protein
MRVLKILMAVGIAVMTPCISNAYALQLAAPMMSAPPLQYSLASNMAQNARTVNSRALWSMYPASVRGRVFGGTGGDPMSRGTISGSGGGW